LKRVFTAHTALHGELSWLELFPSSAYSKEKVIRTNLDVVGSVRCKEDIIVHVTPLLTNRKYVILCNNFHCWC